jgi:hypothetical protein
MTRKTVLGLCAPAMLMAAGVLVSAQIQLPNSAQKKFGGNISPAFEGWFDSPDGTHNLLIEYYSRNTDAEVDVPIGPNNHFEPGNPDMGQPTHFLTRRRYGMFVINVPKDYPKTQKVSWTLTVNGSTISIPFYMHVDYNVSPMIASEEGHDGKYNTPPLLRFEETGPSVQGPVATVAKAISRTATVGTPMPLKLWVDDDAYFNEGANAPRTPPVNVTFSKYRGPGDVTFTDARPKFETSKGGKPAEPYSGTASTTVKFSQPGDYMLHTTIGDYSGTGGNGSGCCWTTAIIKVAVKAAAAGSETSADK